MEPSTDRKYVLIFSALLIGYQYFGILIDGTIPYTQIKFSSQADVKIILILLIIFFGIQFVHKWFKQDKKERSIFDFSSSVLIASVAIAPVCSIFLGKYGIDWKMIFSIIGIFVAGVPLVIAFEFIIVILFSIRKPEEMIKRGLGRIPPVSKTFLSSLFFLIPLTAVIIFCLVTYDDSLPTPIDKYWPVIFFAPTLLLEFNRFIDLLKCLGPAKIRKKAINNLRNDCQAMDLHEMLYQHIGIEKIKDYKKPAIVEFTRDNNLSEVQKLLDSGIDPNTQDYRGWSPLMWATAKKNLDIVKLLLAHGADPNLVNYLGQVAIMFASRYGSYEITKKLVENRAIVNPTINLNNRPPLSEAASRGHLEIVRLLVEHGANIMHKGIDNKSALDLTMDAGYGDVAKYLRRIMHEMDKTPAEDKTNLVKNIGWIGNNDNKGKNIQYSKHSASLKEIHKIRDYKRFLDSQSDEELAEELSIPINAPPQTKQKAMQKRYSKKSSTQEEKIAIEVIPNNPKEKSRVIELPKKLVEKHMDEYFAANPDRNPSEEFIKEAFSYSMDHTLKSTEVHEVGVPLLQEAVEAGNEELVKELLLKKEIDVNEQTEDGWTALLYASAQGYPRILRLLLDAGTNPDIGNLLGITPLIYGAYYGNLEVCKILLEYGANIDTQEGEGLTALMVATRLCLIDAVEMFLKAGANINIKDRNFMTALDHAKKCKQGKIAKLIRTAQKRQRGQKA